MLKPTNAYVELAAPAPGRLSEGHCIPVKSYCHWKKSASIVKKKANLDMGLLPCMRVRVNGCVTPSYQNINSRGSSIHSLQCLSLDSSSMLETPLLQPICMEACGIFAK